MSSRRSRRESVEFFVFVSPWLIGFVAFTLIPLVSSFAVSFTKWDMITRPRFVGVANYVGMVRDPLIWGSLGNTLYYTVFGVPTTIVFGLLMAMIINRQLPGTGFFRSLFYLPTVLSGVAAALLWKWILNPVFGILNHLLGFVGVGGIGWLTDPFWAKPAIILYRMWYVGGTMMIFLAGLKAIPRVLYEAADIDGASPVQKLWRITLPMMTPSIFFVMVTGIINSLQIFSEVYIMMGRQADDVTRPFLQYLWMNAFSYLRMGYASAMAWLLFAVILAVSLVQLALQRRWVYFEVDK